MTLAEQMISDIADVLQNIDEHAVTRNVKDGSGKTHSIVVIIEGRILEQRHTPNGINDFETAMIGMPTTYEVDQTWTFDVEGNGSYWAVDRDRNIENDSAGWMFVPVISSAIIHRGDPDFIAPAQQ
jgi:hypothetical protein